MHFHVNNDVSQDFRFLQDTDMKCDLTPATARTRNGYSKTINSSWFFYLSLLSLVKVRKQSVMEEPQFLAQETRGKVASCIAPAKQTVQLFVKDSIQIWRPVVSECYHLGRRWAEKELVNQ